MLYYSGLSRTLRQLRWVLYPRRCPFCDRVLGNRPACPDCADGLEELRLRATVSRPVSHQRMGTPMVENDSGYKLGQRVRHAKFGEGTIVNMEGSGEHSRLQVAFQGQGIKWLVAAYARLETV